jgi:hypothetical protein
MSNTKPRTVEINLGQIILLKECGTDAGRTRYTGKVQVGHVKYVVELDIGGTLAACLRVTHTTKNNRVVVYVQTRKSVPQKMESVVPCLEQNFFAIAGNLLC